MEEDLLVKVVGTSIFSAFFSHLLQPQGPRGDHGFFEEPSIFDMPLPEHERVAVDLTKHLVANEQPPQVRLSRFGPAARPARPARPWSLAGLASSMFTAI